jgi:hypothetical protein
MTSEQQNAANKKNARHSSGPKTDEGKRKSRLNALKHGLTAKLIDVLPGESQADYDGRIDAFLGDQPTASAAQMVLIKRIVATDWKLDRLDLAQTSAIKLNVRHAEIDFEADAKKHAEEIGRRLIFEPLDRCETPEWREPIVQKRLDQRAADHPKCLLFELERTAHGVNWLLDQWNCFRGMLHFNGYWHYTEKLTVIRLLGKRPEDVLEDCDIGAMFVATHLLHVKPMDFFDGCFQAKLGVIGKSMFLMQLQHMEAQVKKRLFHERVGAFNWLVALVDREMARLEKLKADVLQPMADADRLEASRRARFDPSSAGIALTRYHGALERELHRSINDLMKQRRCDAAFGAPDDDDSETDAAPEPTAAAPESAVLPNEPISQIAKNPVVTSTDPRRQIEPARPSSYIHVSATRNEPSAGDSGSKTDPNAPR